MIEVNALEKTFGSVRALDGLSLNVPDGAVYGLVGPNGAGKTTALQIIAGVYRPTAGDVKVDGEPVFENNALKRRMAYIPSDFYFNQQARIKDLCDMNAALNPSFSRERARELAASFPFEQDRLVRSLSKGTQKQLAFWLALSTRPDVLLLDEPLDGLDPAARLRVLRIAMDEVAQRGMTILVSSHNLRELSDICDHVGIMDKGRMSLERSLDALQDDFAKVQVAFVQEDQVLPAGLTILNESRQGKLYTLVVRGNAAEVEAMLNQAGAVFVNVLPLSLEEVFVYETGGVDHAENASD